MLTKILTVLLLGTLVTRLLLRGPWWKGLGQWFKRFVDVALVVLAVVYGAQLLVLALR